MMARALYKLTLPLLLALFIALGCAQTHVETSDAGNEPPGDGDTEFDGEPDSVDDGGDRDSNGDSPSSGDDDEWPPDSKPGDGDFGGGDFYPPMLSDPSLLPMIFGPEMTSTNLNFGQVRRDRHYPDRSFRAYSFDALPGARITLDLKADYPGALPVLILYGPRGSNGLWRDAVALSTQISSREPVLGRAAIDRFPIVAHGHYLVLVAFPYGGNYTEGFSLSLGCSNQCREPKCPDLTCQGYCPTGFLRDPDGCPSCHCETGADPGFLACDSDGDCPPYMACVGGACEDVRDDDASCICDDLYEPVCGEDGLTYANRCEAECRGVRVRQTGECPEPEGAECRYDSDCPADRVCVNGLCSASANACQCPDIWEPVCGVDGRTYDNRCWLSCAEVELAYAGLCSPEVICRPLCETSPGNGAAGEWLDGCSGQPLNAGDCSGCESRCLYAGSAAEGWYSSCDRSLILRAPCRSACQCPSVWDPVCGVDGVTYTNPCAIACATVAVAHLGECRNPAEGCASDSDCPPGRSCANDPDCANPRGCPTLCLESPGLMSCAADADCLSGQYCYAENRFSDPVCVDIGESGCQVTGCFGEVCAPYRVGTECDWAPKMACFDHATCGIDPDGFCSWMDNPTAGMERCLDQVAMGTTCTVDSDCPVGYFCEQHSVCSPADCVCPTFDAPVCGGNGRVYPNACLAVCEGVFIRALNPCP